MLGMASTHVVIYTVPVSSVIGGASLMFLHASREIFLFISAFILFYTTTAYERKVASGKFWRRRMPLIAIPYVLWTLIYWPLSGGAGGTVAGAVTRLGTDFALGWFHLYFLLLTMQLYLVFPLLAWLLRRTRGHHLAVLAVSVAIQVAMTVVMHYHWQLIPTQLQFWVDGAQDELTSYQLYVVAGAIAAIYHRECIAWVRAHRRIATSLAGVALLVGEGWYVVNLWLGESPDAASDVFQPAVIPLVLGSVLGLWLLAERLLVRHPLDGALWPRLRRYADASFGFYLAHMVPLMLITQAPVLSVLATDQLPALQGTMARLAMVIVATAALVWLIRRTPFCRALTGRTGAVRRATLHD
jgi:peptidoglycan/LPS O-acetylase OafA/YrhL